MPPSVYFIGRTRSSSFQFLFLLLCLNTQPSMLNEIISFRKEGRLICSQLIPSTFLIWRVKFLKGACDTERANLSEIKFSKSVKKSPARLLSNKSWNETKSCIVFRDLFNIVTVVQIRVCTRKKLLAFRNFFALSALEAKFHFHVGIV